MATPEFIAPGRGAGSRAPHPSRRWLLATGGVGGAALLAACGVGGTATTAEKPVTVSKPVTLTAWFPVSGTNGYPEYLQNQVTLFQQSQDKVRVNVEPPGATDKLQAAIVGGTPP